MGLIQNIKANKSIFIRRGIVVLGTAVGLALTVGLLKVAVSNEPEEYIEAEIID